MPTDAARTAVATFRFGVIAPLLVRALGPGERAHILRDLAARLWKTQDGRTIRIHARTLTRWAARYKAQGFSGLLPEERSDRGVGRILPEQIVLRAVALRQEDPERSVLQIIRILELEGRSEPGQIKRTTLGEALCRAGVSRAEVTRDKQTFQLRESPYPNAMWQIDTCHLLHLPDAQGHRRTVYLVACLDDFSRFVVARLYVADDRPAVADLLKRAITALGKPEMVYSDNGGPYHSDMLATACARLGIAPRHTRPYRPQGRGKVERLYAELPIMRRPSLRTSATLSRARCAARHNYSAFKNARSSSVGCHGSADPLGAGRMSRVLRFISKSVSTYWWVVSVLSCPSQRAMTVMSTPDCRRCMAVVCRNVWGDTCRPCSVAHPSAATRTERRSRSSTPARDRGWPARFGNTGAVGSGRVRSRHWARMRSVLFQRGTIRCLRPLP